MNLTVSALLVGESRAHRVTELLLVDSVDGAEVDLTVSALLVGESRAHRVTGLLLVDSRHPVDGAEVDLTASALLVGESRAHRVTELLLVGERNAEASARRSGPLEEAAASLGGGVAISSSIGENARVVGHTTDRFGARTSHGIDSWRTLIGVPPNAELGGESLPFLVEESRPVDNSVRNAVDGAVDGSWTIRRPDLSTPLLHVDHWIPTKSDPYVEVHKGVTSTGLTD